jgi:hypothetical protein
MFIHSFNRTVYELCKSERLAEGLETLQAAYFFKLWREDPKCSHIKVRRHLRFAKCATCVALRERRAKTRDPQDLEDLNKEVREHHNMVKEERAAYYLRRLQAVQQPQKYMSVIIDGADQSRFHLPHFKELSHANMGNWGIHLHLMGILNHGRQPITATYLPNVKQGNNVTIDCLHLALVHNLKREGVIPPTVYVQLDNTTKQCKSRFFLGYCAYLVHLGVVKDVVISFLPVGHTHEDIDQLFSRISVYLQQHDARSRVALEEAVHSAYTAAAHRSGAHRDQAHRVAEVIHRDRASNISDFLDPYIANLTAVGSDNDLFTHRQQFHIFRRPCRPTLRQEFRDRVGFEVHVETRTNAKGDWARAIFSGMKTNEVSTPIFKYDDEETVGFLLQDDPFEDVPDAQAGLKASHADNEDKRVADRAKLERMVRKTIEARGGFLPDDLEDLDVCLDLLRSDDPLPFDWDTTLYKEGMDSRQGFGVQLSPQERDFRDKINQGYKVGSYAIIKAPAGDPEGLYFAKIMEHLPEKSSVMVKYGEPHADTTGKPAKHRRYIFRKPAAGNTQRSTWDEACIETLQMPGVLLKRNTARVLEFAPASAKTVQYWLDQLVKTKEREEEAARDAARDAEADENSDDSEDERMDGIE